MMATTTRLDDDGFLADPQDWDRQVAEDIALEEGLPELTEDHMRLLRTLREQVLGRGDLPPMRQVCRHAGLEEACVTDLLADPRRAWRIAGLPNPGEEAKAYLAAAEQTDRTEPPQ